MILGQTVLKIGTNWCMESSWFEMVTSQYSWYL